MFFVPTAVTACTATAEKKRERIEDS